VNEVKVILIDVASYYKKPQLVIPDWAYIRTSCIREIVKALLYFQTADCEHTD